MKNKKKSFLSKKLGYRFALLVVKFYNFGCFLLCVCVFEFGRASGVFCMRSYIVNLNSQRSLALSKSFKLVHCCGLGGDRAPCKCQREGFAFQFVSCYALVGSQSPMVNDYTFHFRAY